MKTFNDDLQIKANIVGVILYWIFSPFIFILTFGGPIRSMNGFKRKEIKIQEAASGIDVQLVQRTDTLSKLIDATKQAIKWEANLLKDVIALRNQNPADMSLKEKNSYASKMDTISKGVQIQLENYPQLQGTKNILDLQAAIREIEENLSAARRIFNSNVSQFNQEVSIYPSNVLAKRRYTRKELFEASEEQRRDVKIDLGI